MAKTRFGALSTKRYLNINVRNSLVGGKNIIDINSKSNLNWYACGPTVYDVSHLGHARTYICTDVIRRILSNYFKVSVNFVLGMTDLDDKIINRAKSKDVDWNTLARQYENEFFADMISLNVLEPDAVLRVTEHIPEIIKYIEHIMVMGKAYHIQSGVYFDIKNCKSYKKLSPDAGTDSVEEGNEGDVTSSGKRDPRDFVLWKAAKPGEPSWPSPWGLGRPGWHIECSAATHAMFGDAVHIHSGGIDLKFPHHTNEIAQW
jgi:cysteinyl-tRNA synthetase